MSYLKKCVIFSIIGVFLASFPLLADNGVGEFDEKTREILEIFQEISAIPRCSGSEGRISRWVTGWAEKNGFEAERDEMGNVVIHVPASRGFEKAPSIVIQGHLDMVCEKEEGAAHDFSRDPLRLVYEGRWLTADKTTLGADNGLGVAICLALATDASVGRPQLELLFTVGEESGFIGARALKKDFFKSRIFINIDSESARILTIGSAGGTVAVIDLPLSTERLPEEFKVYGIRASGFPGGHSGVNIAENRGNPIKAIAEALQEISGLAEIRLVDLKGGTRSNAIPRRAEGRIAFDPSRFPSARELISGIREKVQAEYGAFGTTPSVALTPSESGEIPEYGLSKKDSVEAIALLCDLPNGVVGWAPGHEGRVVETSNNIGRVDVRYHTMSLVTFQRGSDMSKLEALSARIMNAASDRGGHTTSLKTLGGRWDETENNAGRK